MSGIPAPSFRASSAGTAQACAHDGREERGRPRLRSPVVAGVALLVSGCLNLDLPDVRDGGVPPTLRVAAPAANARVPLQTLVSIESDSVAGVSSVLVSCAGLTVAGWVEPPFSGVVDLSGCRASSTASDAGTGFVSVTLHVVSVSGAGASTSVDVPIVLDGRLPVLQVDYSPTAAPHGPYEVRVTPDRPLSAAPVVALAGAKADRTLTITDGGLLPTYVAQFDDTPGIGADAWDGGDPVPIELLSETERATLLTVDAKSQENGNQLHLDLSVLLSRVGWDRPAPGRLALLAASSVVAGAGLEVPLATDDLVPTATSRWLPGLLRGADGVFVSFDPGLLPGGLDGGFTALGVDGTGNTLFHDAAGTSGLWFPPAATAAPAPAPLAPALVPPLIRAVDLLCGPDTFDTAGAGCLPATTTQSVTCSSASQPPFTTSGSPGGAVSLGRPAPGATAASGLNYLAPAAPGCGDLWAFGPLGGALAFAPHSDPVRATCTLDSVRQLLPVGDGTFIVALVGTCSGVADFPVLRVDAAGALRGSYVTARAATTPNPVQPVGALPDGTLVTVRNAPPYTVFERWAEGAPAPTSTARIAGLFATVPGQVPSVPANAVAAQDGSLTVLLSGGPNGTAVAHFGPGLVARWLYFYPRTLVPTTDAPVLVGSPPLPGAYLLDTRNQRLVALRTTAGAAACTVSGVSVSAAPASVPSGAPSTLTATVSASPGCPTGITWNSSPAGGTLTPNGSTATFSAPTAGTYTITATSVTDPTKSGSATVTVTGAAGCGAPNGTVVTHSANITVSETWAGNGVTHSVPGSITVGSAAVVTIQPCAYVSMGANATITVNGTARLVAAGTSPSQSISFVRANSTRPWGILRGASPTSLIDLSYTTLQGGGAFGGQYGNPAIAAFGNGYFVTPVPVVRVNNVLLDSPQGGGVYLDAGGAFTSDSTGLTVQGAPGYVLSMGMMALTSVPAGNYSAASNLLPMVNVFGTFNVFGDVTIHKHLPVRIQVGGFTVAPSGGNTAPVTLTIEPGARLLFPKTSPTTSGARVIFGTNGNPPNNLVGVLNAQGTAAEPIVFTSGEATPAPGDWVGLWLDTATGSRLDHVVIEYAGADSSISSANCRPAGTRDNAALLVGDFSTQYVPPTSLLTNSVLRFSAGFGIDAMWQAPTFSAPDIATGNTFQNNALCAQTHNALSSGTCGTNLGCTVQ
jgi:hypothetical protein